MGDYISWLRSKVGHEKVILVFAGGCLFNDEGKVLLQKRGDSGKWGFPGGAIELGETPEETAVRELKEETGLDVKDIQYLFSSPNVYEYSGMGIHTLDMDFLVRVHGDSVAVTAADDAAEAFWIPIKEVNPTEFGLTSIRNAVIRFIKYLR